MPLELLKVIVQPVVLERDDEGKIVGERVGNAVPLYGQEEVEKYFSSIQDEITTANETEKDQPS
jgi:hypothetical protein